MTAFPRLDPLFAARSLLDCITGRDGSKADLEVLAGQIDAFMYSLRFLRVETIPPIPDTDAEPSEASYNSWRGKIGPRFASLGSYWCVFSSRMVPGQNTEASIGDAVDDLADIARELVKAEWYLENVGETDALASLRWSYESHLWMHLIPLRSHLEDEIFDK